jgi:nitrate/nitrite-specific signal transduction histidine kinase
MPPNEKSKQQREALRRKTRLSPTQRRLGHENLVFVYALLAGLPGVATVIILLFSTEVEAHVVLTVLGLVLPLWLGFAWAARVRVVHSLHILTNVLGAVRENDFTIRARGSGHRDALYEVTRELNQLTQQLQRARFGEVEASA